MYTLQFNFKKLFDKYVFDDINKKARLHAKLNMKVGRVPSKI
jgi:hypothetical protein